MNVRGGLGLLSSQRLQIYSSAGIGLSFWVQGISTKGIFTLPLTLVSLVAMFERVGMMDETKPIWPSFLA